MKGDQLKKLGSERQQLRSSYLVMKGKRSAHMMHLPMSQSNASATQLAFALVSATEVPSLMFFSSFLGTFKASFGFYSYFFSSFFQTLVSSFGSSCLPQCLLQGHLFPFIFFHSYFMQCIFCLIYSLSPPLTNPWKSPSPWFKRLLKGEVGLLTLSPLTSREGSSTWSSLMIVKIFTGVCLRVLIFKNGCSCSTLASQLEQKSKSGQTEHLYLIPTIPLCPQPSQLTLLCTTGPSAFFSSSIFSSFPFSFLTKESSEMIGCVSSFFLKEADEILDLS